MPTPFANHPAHPSGDSPRPLPHNDKNPKSSLAPAGRGRKTKEPRMRASRLKIRRYRRIWTPERARIIRAMLPGVVQTRPPKIRRRGGPAGSPKGEISSLPYSPGPLAPAWRQAGIRIRAGTARHSPASGNACTCQNPQRASARLRVASGRTPSVLPCRPGNSLKIFRAKVCLRRARPPVKFFFIFFGQNPGCPGTLTCKVCLRFLAAALPTGVLWRI